MTEQVALHADARLRHSGQRQSHELQLKQYDNTIAFSRRAIKANAKESPKTILEKPS